MDNKNLKKVEEREEEKKEHQAEYEEGNQTQTPEATIGRAREEAKKNEKEDNNAKMSTNETGKQNGGSQARIRSWTTGSITQALSGDGDDAWPSATALERPPKGKGQQSKYDWENVFDPTLRRTSLQRTPPSDLPLGERLGNHDLHTPKFLDQDTNTDLPMGEELEASPMHNLYAEEETIIAKSPEKKKRKRESKEKGDEKDEKQEDEISRELKEVLIAMERLTNKTDELRNWVKISTKTRVEIKAVTRELNNVVQNLNRKMDALKSDYLALRSKLNGKTSEETSHSQKEYNTLGVQATEEEILAETDSLRKDIHDEIETKIVENEGWIGLSSIIDYNWPTQSFKNTELRDIDVLKDQRGDVAVIVNLDLKFMGKVADEVKAGFPDITYLMEEGLEDGVIEYIKTNTKTILSKGKKEDQTRTLYVLPLKIDANGSNDMENLYGAINKLKEETLVHQTTRIKIATHGTLDIEYLRKCTEYAFRKSSIVVDIVEEGNRRNRHKSVSERNLTEKVIIRAEGKQYADVLRTVKNSVDIDELNIKVKSIKKTGKGDVMMEVQGGKDKAEALKLAIQRKNEDTRVEVRNYTEVVHITGIDGETSSDEIEEAVGKCVGNAKVGDIKVQSVRPNLYGGQSATVVLKKELARRLVKTGYVKIGWVPCRVRARVNIVRCFRCLEFGHRVGECKGTDKSNICIKCGQEGHRAKCCENDAYCIVCKQGGHRSDQTRCPNYRKLVNEKAKIASTSRNRLASAASVSATKNGG